jgi:hypothetical protein
MIREMGTLTLLAMLGVATPGAVAAQGVVGHSAERTGKNVHLTFDLADGSQLVVEIRDGTVYLNGSAIGAAESQAGGATLDELETGADALTTAQLLAALAQLSDGKGDLAALNEALAGLSVADVVMPEIVVDPAVEIGDVAPAPRADRPLRPDPRPRVRVDVAPHIADAVIGEHGSASFVGGLVGGASKLLAVFVSLACMGLGFLVFAPRQLETVADTVWHSFWRSFLAGLFAQPLLVPAFGMLIVGLALTVVGIVVIPFAILGFVAALVLAAIGGFIGVARTVGEIYLRRRMAQGEVVPTWGSYRYIVYGLAGLLAVWLPVVLLGWIPVAGTLLTVSAAVITWILATAGFGATIISRGGMRGTFVRQLDLALTDEQYWTDEAMPTPVRRERVRRYR